MTTEKKTAPPWAHAFALLVIASLDEDNTKAGDPPSVEWTSYEMTGQWFFDFYPLGKKTVHPERGEQVEYSSYEVNLHTLVDAFETDGRLEATADGVTITGAVPTIETTQPLHKDSEHLVDVEAKIHFHAEIVPSDEEPDFRHCRLARPPLTVIEGGRG